MIREFLHSLWDPASWPGFEERAASLFDVDATLLVEHLTAVAAQLEQTDPRAAGKIDRLIAYLEMPELVTLRQNSFIADTTDALRKWSYDDE